jgi:hypothetical protein
MTERADRDLQALYMRLYFDEDVSRDIVENLRQRGFDVLSARDAGQLRLDDDEQLAFAVAQERALVTHNRHHFELRHQHCVSAGQSHWGIIIAKRRAGDAVVVHKLLALLDTATADEMRNQLRYI